LELPPSSEHRQAFVVMDIFSDRWWMGCVSGFSTLDKIAFRLMEMQRK
jgi:hypothetical protein